MKCDDCISRQAVIEYIEGSEAELGHSPENELVCQHIKELPPVTLDLTPCDDAISRQAVLDEISDYNNDLDYTTNELYDRIKRMSSVTPQPKTGHWKAKSFHELFCDNCGFDFDIMKNDFMDKMNHCPNCGCRMIEPQERSE